MLSAGRGGLEQAHLDYCEALALEGHRTIAVLHPDAPARAALDALSVEQVSCRSLGEWDPLAVRRLRRLLLQERPGAAITIGRRAGALFRRARAGLSDGVQIAVEQNYSFKHIIGLDRILATTGDLRAALVAAGHPADRVEVVPNMVRVPEDARAVAARRVDAPVIGALGRFVEKKGFHHLIDALALLRDRGHDFVLLIAGDGPDAGALRARVARCGLQEKVRFTGWISDKASFFSELDVFCVPSLHEPFGIVVVEGFAHGQASVLADAEGPREIARDEHDALMVRRGDPGHLAQALARLLAEPDLRHRLGRAALATARERYDLPVVARQLTRSLEALEASPRLAQRPDSGA